MIHFGQMKCGKVDQFGRLFHVVSEFFHVNFVPIIPLRTLLVRGETSSGDEIAAMPIRMSLKSVAAAWVRTALVLLILFQGLAMLRDLTRLLFVPALRKEGAWDAVLNPLYLVIGCLIFFFLTYRFTRPSWARTLHLAALLGMTEEDLDAHLDALYRGAGPEEAEDAEPEVN